MPENETQLALPKYEASSKVVDPKLKDWGLAMKSVACSSSHILTSTSRPVVKVYQVGEAEASEVREISLTTHGSAGSSCVEVSEVGGQNLAAVCYDDGGIGIWDMRTSGRVADLAASASQSTKVKFMQDGNQLVSGGSSGSLCFWDIRRGGIRPEYEVSSSSSARRHSADEPAMKRRKGENGKIDMDEKVNGVDLRPARDDTSSPILSLGVSPDGSLVACGRSSGIVSALRVGSEKFHAEIRSHRPPVGVKKACVRALTFDGRRVVSGGDDKHISSFNGNMTKGRSDLDERRMPQPVKFPAHLGWLTSLSMCPSAGKHLAVSTSWDNSVKLWDLSRQSVVQSYKEHSASVLDSSFSTTGKFFATVGADAQMSLYVNKQ